MPEWRFWHCTPKILRAYNKAYEYRLTELDEIAWINGKYTFVAVSTALSNALSKPGRTPKKYPEKPFSLDNQANSDIS